MRKSLKRTNVFPFLLSFVHNSQSSKVIDYKSTTAQWHSLDPLILWRSWTTLKSVPSIGECNLHFLDREMHAMKWSRLWWGDAWRWEEEEVEFPCVRVRDVMCILSENVLMLSSTLPVWTPSICVLSYSFCVFVVWVVCDECKICDVERKREEEKERNGRRNGCEVMTEGTTRNKWE